ncbi:CAMK protein kinase [Phytophthora nicotianae CJ01A1]|uniref:CAMK protein kinase n=4 Tax=Phytophthora nicotianae TaxID=4792 RepID=W2PHV6_PHYN3|nr:CAMK protein kinase [Phytophthora nicotianae INRA-310]ETL78909.1 CAMK protein kinase [Phytophthora nicotianae]ETM99778.1 CAMK protein kinase [Phytophthora nicotianae INRA-310]ETO60606.1 CAMK protein kinase [Phytophthora nicotianae P1976]ETP01713.1 CAMK protein kinase [Phytophthora nicotianae CJ01A1]
MDVWFVTTQYPKYGDHPPYETVSHPAVSSHSRPFSMHVPSIYLVWDSKLGVIALRRRERQLAVSRCGLVLAGVYFRIDQAATLQIPVALKIMDRAQVLLQRDDVESEIRVMGQLQMGGLDAPLANEHMIRWEYASDVYNQYVATEYVANGSLQAYAHRRVHQLMFRHLQEFAQEHGTAPTKLECISYVYRGSGHEWMREGIGIFKGIVRALTYLHAQNVAHLDLDVYNVAVDVRTSSRIIDLGSSQIMDNRGLVGEGYVSIKCKPLFVAPEVRSHQRMAPPRPGFNGAAADMWATGVILVQCVVWGFRGGPTYLLSNTNWRREVFSHIDAACSPKTCHLCVNFISIPPLIGAIIKQLLHVDPKQRPSAYEVAMALQENRQVQLFPVHPRIQG